RAPYPPLLSFVERTRGEPSPHVHDGSARAGNSPHTRAYSLLWSARAESLFCTCAMGAHVPVTRPARARTLFCGAHARGTSSARARTYYKASRRHVFRFRQTKKQSRKKKDSYIGVFLFLLCLFFKFLRMT